MHDGSHPEVLQYVIGIIFLIGLLVVIGLLALIL